MIPRLQYNVKVRASLSSGIIGKWPPKLLIWRGEAKCKILPSMNSKSPTSIRNVSLNPNLSSTFSCLTILLKYPLYSLLLTHSLLLPRVGFLPPESMSSFKTKRNAADIFSAIFNLFWIWVYEWMNVRMLDGMLDERVQTRKFVIWNT